MQTETTPEKQSEKARKGQYTNAPNLDEAQNDQLTESGEIVACIHHHQASHTHSACGGKQCIYKANTRVSSVGQHQQAAANQHNEGKAENKKVGRVFRKPVNGSGLPGKFNDKDDKTAPVAGKLVCKKSQARIPFRIVDQQHVSQKIQGNNNLRHPRPKPVRIKHPRQHRSGGHESEQQQSDGRQPEAQLPFKGPTVGETNIGNEEQ